jgi:DNA polymerase iota
VTDVVDYNASITVSSAHDKSYFQISKEDPIIGFSFDANKFAGHTFPPAVSEWKNDGNDLSFRLRLASHLAQHIRLQLETVKGYTASVGISTSMLLSKLVGSVNKPGAQTTLLPPYVPIDNKPSNVALLIDNLELRKLPGIGFRTADSLRQLVLRRPPRVKGWEVDPDDKVLVRDLRTVPGIGIASLDLVLSRPGAPHGIGTTVWNIIHGVDDCQVSLARDVPKQISIEDSFGGLSTITRVNSELVRLTGSLLRRMRVDLFDRPNDRWIAVPQTLRLSTQTRSQSSADVERQSTTRISRSAVFPRFAIDDLVDVDVLARRVVREVLLNLFIKLHPVESKWDIRLINVAIANLQYMAGEGRNSVGRDIGDMFHRQNELSSAGHRQEMHIPHNVGEQSPLGSPTVEKSSDLKTSVLSEGNICSSQFAQHTLEWIEDESGVFEESVSCPVCSTFIPTFAISAHARFHDAGE